MFYRELNVVHGEVVDLTWFTKPCHKYLCETLRGSPCKVYIIY